MKYYLNVCCQLLCCFCFRYILVISLFFDKKPQSLKIHTNILIKVSPLDIFFLPGDFNLLKDSALLLTAQLAEHWCASLAGPGSNPDMSHSVIRGKPIILLPPTMFSCQHATLKTKTKEIEEKFL